MVIGVNYEGPELYFKVDKTKYSNDLKDYFVSWDTLYYKGKEVEVPVAENEGNEQRPREISWYQSNYGGFFDDKK